MRDALHHLTLAAVLLWWAPTLALALAAFLADRARFKAAMAAVDVLVALGRRDAALALLRAEVRRCERQQRALEGRR